MVLLQGPKADVVEAVVSVTRGEIDRWEIVPRRAAAASDRGVDRRHRRACRTTPSGTPPWTGEASSTARWCRSTRGRPGAFGLAHEEGRRITRCLAYLRESKEDNGYARPLEGLLAFVDMGRGEVLEVVDDGLTPIPPTSGSYYPEDNGPLRTDLRPLEITQPEGPSFTVEDNLIRWQKWSLRVGMDPLEGLVLWRVGYEDGGRVRPILYRASVSEMVVPYGDPGPMHAWKSAFDAGSGGSGAWPTPSRSAATAWVRSITSTTSSPTSEASRDTRANAICLHEEDYGILWKHVDLVSGRTEVRRSRRLVVSSIATVGNYEYGFYWYFYLDGTMQLEVKLTGIMSTMAVGEAGPGEHASMVAPGLAAPFHQHLFNVRLDVEVDGPDNAVYEVDTVGGVRTGSPENPWGNVFGRSASLLQSELAARRDVDPSRSRTWRVANRRPSQRRRTADRLQVAALGGPDTHGRP